MYPYLDPTLPAVDTFALTLKTTHSNLCLIQHNWGPAELTLAQGQFSRIDWPGLYHMWWLGSEWLIGGIVAWAVVKPWSKSAWKGLAFVFPWIVENYEKTGAQAQAYSPYPPDCTILQHDHNTENYTSIQKIWPDSPGSRSLVNLFAARQGTVHVKKHNKAQPTRANET